MQHLLNYQDWINKSLEEWQLITENEGWGDWLSSSLNLVGDIAAAVPIVLYPNHVIQNKKRMALFKKKSNSKALY